MSTDLYLLDSNTVSTISASDSYGYDYAIEKFQRCEETDLVCISILTMYEFQYAIANTPENTKRNLKESMSLFMNFFTPVPLSATGAMIFGDLRREFERYHGMKKRESQRHVVDLMIAATAIDCNAIVVSADRIFRTLTKIDYRLKHEDWIIP